MADYDVAVIGAGIAGSVCANYLVREGKRVLLLEQNHQSGGNMSGFSRKGFYFDGGDQSFESLGAVFPILQDLGVYHKHEWIKARYRMVSKDFDFYIDGIDAVEDALRAAFPAEPGFKPLFAEIREVSRFLDSVCTPWEFPLLHDFSLRRLAQVVPWLAKLKRWSTFAYRERACSVIRNPELRHWLTQIGYYRMPYLFFAGFWHIWSHDYWYPCGGMQSLHRSLMDAFTEAGGEVRFNTRVSRIQGGSSAARRALQLTTAEGDTVSATSFVYAGDYRALVSELLGPEYCKPALVRKLNGTRLTEGLVSVYLGLNLSDQALADRLGGAHHPFYFPNYDVIFPHRDSPRDVHSRMWLALNHFGPQSRSAPEGRSTLTLQTYSSHAWQHHWNNGGESYPRTAEYRELKQQVGQEMVTQAENLVPELKRHIEFMDVGTPLSLKRFTGNAEGSSGGWCYDNQVSPLFRLPQLNMIRTPLENLYACGHYALWPGGVISAVQCGRIVANLVCGRRALAPLAK
ncbi:MAG: NAD(P)/FAD-dependent oxidoreductase [Spirochaetaceae bacterium]|nr:MAG: NAD(P)/FAD-dependent oxidoreductase [Spirochaetaceae bacterium]